MSTLQTRIDEYLRNKTPADDVEVTNADSSEYLRETEEIDVRAMRESLDKRKQLVSS